MITGSMIDKFLFAISCKITNDPKITFWAEKITELKKRRHIPWITKRPVDVFTEQF